jgi:hypothetical protein
MDDILPIITFVTMVYHGYRISAVALVSLASHKFMCLPYCSYLLEDTEKYVYENFLKLNNVHSKFHHIPSSGSVFEICRRTDGWKDIQT